MRALAGIVGLVTCVVACGRFLAANDDARDAGAPAADSGDESTLADGASASSSCVAPSDAKQFFCRTFDEPGLTSPFGFDDIENPNQATLSLVDAPSRTGKALKMTLEDGAFQRAFMLVKGLEAPAERYDLSFDLFVVSSSLTYAAIGALRFLGSNYAAFPGIAEYDSARFFSKLAPEATEVTATNGKWQHVSVEARLTNGVLTSSIFVDGQLAGNDGRTNAVPGNLGVSLALGYFFTGDQPGAMDVLVDDLVVVVR